MTGSRIELGGTAKAAMRRCRPPVFDIFDEESAHRLISSSDILDAGADMSVVQRGTPMSP